MAESHTNGDVTPRTTDPPRGPRSSSYVVVARRYRPTGFDELIGQGQVAQALTNAILTDRVGHAYLFTGARGVGKTSTARIFGRALNCVEGPTPTPCNRCDICLSVASGEDVDVLEIDGASNRGIEEIRQLRSTVNVRPSRARFKIYIIDEVHMLTTPAFNALLKTLEEPPGHVKFIFCTTDPEKIPITVLSRCQRFDFVPVATQDILGRLKTIAAAEGVEADDEALAVIARRAAGSMRDSQSLLEQLLSFCGSRITVVDVHRMLGTAQGGRIADLLEAMAERDVPRTLTELDGAMHDGVDAGQLAEQLLVGLRDLLVSVHGGDPNLLAGPLAADVSRMERLDALWDAATTMAAMQVIDQAMVRMRQSLHPRVLLEMALIRIATLPDLESIDRLVHQAQANPARLGAVTSTPGSAPVTGSASAAAKKKGMSPPAEPLGTIEPNEPSEPEAGTVRGDDGPSRGHQAAAPQRHDDLNAGPDRPEGAETAAALGGASDGPRATTHRIDPAAPPGPRAAPATSSSPVPSDRPPRSLGPETGSPADRSPMDPTAPASAPGPVQDGTRGPDAGVSGGEARRGSGAAPAKVMVADDPVRPGDAEAARLWLVALDSISETTSDFAREFERVATSGPNTLVVTLRSSYNKEICEKPDRRMRLEQAVSEVMGRKIHLEFRAIPGRSGGGSEQPQPTRREQVRSIQRHPFVAQALELFDGEVIDVTAPRSRRN